jgi:hypothetical protein
MSTNNYTNTATRASVLTLKAYGRPSQEVAHFTGLSIRQVNRILARAIERGFDPQLQPLQIKDTYVQDAPRSGRPKKQDDDVTEAVLTKVRRDCYGSEKTCTDLSEDLRDLGI